MQVIALLITPCAPLMHLYAVNQRPDTSKASSFPWIGGTAHGTFLNLAGPNANAP